MNVIPHVGQIPVRSRLVTAALWFVFVGAYVPAHAVVAQQPAEVIKRVAVETPRVTEPRVTLRLSNVRLPEALTALQRASGASISYSATVIPTQHLVSVVLDDVPVSDALQQIVRGTNVRVTMMADGTLLLFVPPGARLVQGQGAIVAKVIDAKTKQPVAGATVTVDDGKKGTATDPSGVARISAPEGSHQVAARAVGYIRLVKPVSVQDGHDVVVEIALTPNASVLDEVIVTGTVVATERKAIPTPITVITAEDIDKRGVTRIEELFRGGVPGVIALDRGAEAYGGLLTYGANRKTISSMETSKVYARGASSLDLGATNPLKTFIDGVELLDPDFLGTIDPRSIERIEVIAGPQAATIYGSGALGGVMQIFTKKGNHARRTDITLDARYGVLENNLNTARAPLHEHTLTVAGGTGDEFSYSGNLTYNFTGQWQPGLTARRYGGSVGVTHARGPLNASGSVSVTSGRNGSYEGSVAYGTPYAMDRVESGEWGFDDTGRIRYKRHGTSSSQTTSLSVDYRFTPWLRNGVTLGRNQQTSSLEDERPRFGWPTDTLRNVATSAGRRNSAGYNLSVLATPTSFLSSTLTLGANGSWGEANFVRGCRDVTASANFAPCYAGDQVTVSDVLDDRSWGGFGSWQVGMLERLFFTAALRGETNNAYGDDHKIDWTPRYGVAYNTDIQNLTIKVLGSYGRATRAPNPDWKTPKWDTYTFTKPGTFQSQLDAPDLTPEYSRGPQGGIEVYFGTRGSVTVNHYQQKVTALIQRVQVDSLRLDYICCPGAYSYGGIGRYMNVGTILQKGWDVTAGVNLWLLSVRGTYSWTDSRVQEVSPLVPRSAGWYPGRTMAGVPTHTGYLTASYAHGPTSVTLDGTFIGRFTSYGRASDVYDQINYARIRIYADRTVDPYSSGVDYDVPTYQSFNLSLGQRVTPWAQVTVKCTNLANSFKSEVGYRAAVLGRQTLVGVSIKRP